MPIDNVAKVIVLDPAGQVLLLRRSKDDADRPGDWDFPGGGIEADESLKAAAIRELFEEAGLELQEDDLRLIYTATKPASNRDVSVNRFVFTAQLPEGQDPTLSREHESYAWLTIADVLREFTHPVYAAALRYASEYNLLP